jgi:protein-S-isoprenylcysteine O-methyltransferase Ste14
VVHLHTTPSVVLRITLWIALLFGGAGYALYQDWRDPLFQSIGFHLFSAVFGIFILMMAFRAAANGGRELAKGRTGEIPRLETNQLVTTGIYSCMRHPMLFGLTLLPLGWALLLGLPTFIFKLAPLEMLFIIIMVVVFEEMEVRKKFADAYVAYAQKVPMVSFRWKCLRTLFSKKKEKQNRLKDLK